MSELVELLMLKQTLQESLQATERRISKLQKKATPQGPLSDQQIAQIKLKTRKHKSTWKTS